MMGGNNNNHMFPVVVEEKQFQHPSNPGNQLQLFGNFTAGCSSNPVNYPGNERKSCMIQPNKKSRDAEDVPREQNLQISSKCNNFIRNGSDHAALISKQNPVSTGLRLSYDDDERNSTVTSASGSMAAAPAVLSLLENCLKPELEQQKEETEKFIKAQEVHLLKGVGEMKERHMASFVAALEKGINKKLHEKELELQNMNRKNKELVDRIKQVSMEAHNWHCRAKYNESVVHMLKSNLQQAMSQGMDLGQEGFGDSEVDDAVSRIDPKNYVSIQGGHGNLSIGNPQGQGIPSVGNPQGQGIPSVSNPQGLHGNPRVGNPQGLHGNPSVGNPQGLHGNPTVGNPQGLHGNPSVGNRQSLKLQMTCRACKVKEASVLLVPCRHLCVCKGCDGFVNVCPVCQMMKTASIQVHFP